MNAYVKQRAANADKVIMDSRPRVVWQNENPQLCGAMLCRERKKERVKRLILKSYGGYNYVRGTLVLVIRSEYTVDSSQSGDYVKCTLFRGKKNLYHFSNTGVTEVLTRGSWKPQIRTLTKDQDIRVLK